MRGQILLLLVSILIFVSCEEDTNTIGYYLSKIKERLTTEELFDIKSKRGSELIDYIRADFGTRVFNDSIHIEYADVLDTLLSARGIVKDKYKFVAIYMAIHYKCNNLEISYDKINSEIEHYYNRMYEEEMERYKKRSEIAGLNFNSFEVNDTICLLLPFENITKEEGNLLMYEEEYYDMSLLGANDDVLKWPDTLKLEGVIIEKNKEKFELNDDVEFFGYDFKVKILSLSKNGNLRSTRGNLSVGGSLDVDLNQYLQEIRNCPPPS